MTASADSSIPTKVLSTDHIAFVFSSFSEFAQKVFKTEEVFTILYSKINMNLVNLLTHIKEITDFLREKPRQLLSVEVNFGGYFCPTFEMVL